MLGHQILEELAEPKAALPQLNLGDNINRANIEADWAIERLGLDKYSNYMILLVGDHSGKLSKGDVTTVLMQDFGITLKQAEAAYQRARATGVIHPKTSFTLMGVPQEFGELYFSPNK